MDELCQCPYCGLDKIFVGVHDDEGNYHGRVGCEYEKSPWSGLSYALHHRRPYYLYLACLPPM